jgi:2,4-didehydro-3-deoxy-L-rhamnonate hydrolase
MKILKIILIALALTTAYVTYAQTLDHAQIKLFRFGEVENEKPAVEYPDGKRLDVSAFGQDYNEAFFAGNGVQKLQLWLKENAMRCPVVLQTERFGACVARPSKIVAIGFNYAAHVKEGNGPSTPIPSEPIIFFKSATAMCGPFDNAIIPKGAEKMDWEVELAIVISKKASYVSETDALNYVAGYSIMNDYSERSWQLEKDGGQWDKGKSADSFAPMGPYLILPENIGDPQKLNLLLKVNGKIMQNANTKDMVFNIAKLISYTSHHMTLLAGDVISTGTPSGIGLAQKPPIFLKPGDEVELQIENIGTQKQKVVSFIESQLTKEEFKNYQEWVALGVGGLPHTLEGFRSVQAFNKQMGDPLDVTRIAPLIGTKQDKAFLEKLPRRKGVKPVIAPFAIPHRQTNQFNDIQIRTLQQKVFDDEVVKNVSLVHYQTSGFERNNKAIFLKDTLHANPELKRLTRGEIAHIHPSDGSMHMTFLSPSDAKTVIESGWGEFHGLAGSERLTATYMMIYSPRDKRELEITKRILEAAIKFASFVPDK